MERELCLALDIKGYHRLVLKKGLSYEIDEYTSKFEDAKEIRKKYQKEIDEFLTRYEEQIKNSNNPNYTGRIVVVIPELVGKDIKQYQKKVIYKKHIATFNDILKDKIIMMSFSDFQRRKPKEERLVADAFHRNIRYPWSRKYGVKTYLNNWIKEEKRKQKDYYEIIRDMMIVYEMERERIKSLPSIEQLYLNIKQEKLNKKIQKRNKLELQKNSNHTLIKDSIKIEEIDEDKMYNVNGNRYTVDELHLFDIEDITEISDYIPDGAKKI